MGVDAEALDLKFQLIEERDIPALTSVMKRAFEDDAQKYLGQTAGGPPGYDDGGFFYTWLLPYNESVGYKIVTGMRVSMIAVSIRTRSSVASASVTEWPIVKAVIRTSSGRQALYG